MWKFCTSTAYQNMRRLEDVAICTAVLLEANRLANRFNAALKVYRNQKGLTFELTGSSFEKEQHIVNLKHYLERR